MAAGTPRRRFSLASLVAVAFAAFALASAPSAAAQESLAASCDPPPTTYPSAAPDNFLAQDFTSTLSGTLTRAEIAVLEPAVETADFIVQIRTVDGSGEPTTAILASTVVPDSSVAQGETLLEASFANPGALVAGQRYAVVIRRPGGQLTVGTRAGCPGQSWQSAGGVTWGAVFTDDLVFRVFVLPPASPTSAACNGKPATHVGTPGNDVLLGTTGPDVIVGLGGDDRIKGFGGKDLICAGDGADIVKGANGADRLFGEGDDDRAFGGAGKDALRGGSGDDGLYGRGNRDIIKGNRGDDKLGGGGGKDLLKGNKGKDKLFGQGGNDKCNGGTGRDKEKSC